MKKMLFLIFAAILTITTSCDKENTEPASECAKEPSCPNCDWEIFTCKINGEDWCANCDMNSQTCASQLIVNIIQEVIG